MIEAIRSERRFGVTAQLTSAQQMRLYAFINSDTWPDLLDIMEMVCIEQESKLLNTEAADEAKVLAEHKMSKAAWQIFVHMQEKIAEQANYYRTMIATEPARQALSKDERYLENLLDPTRGNLDDAEDAMLGDSR